MREIKCEDITSTVKRLCIEATEQLPKDVYQSLIHKYQEEDGQLAKKTLNVLITLIWLKIIICLFVRIQEWLLFILQWVRKYILAVAV